MRTDMTRLIVAFRNFPNVPIKRIYCKILVVLPIIDKILQVRYSELQKSILERITQYLTQQMRETSDTTRLYDKKSHLESLKYSAFPL